jgi:hypothetical protein
MKRIPSGHSSELNALTAATIKAFPRVPLTVVLWKGDEEFPAAASILFDSSITDYLPVEDIIELSETTVWRLVRLSKQA